MPVNATEAASTDVVAYGTISVTTSATLIRASNSLRLSMLIQAIDGDVYIGSNNSVTISTGVKVALGNSFTTEQYYGAVYAIAASTVDVRYWEEG